MNFDWTLLHWIQNTLVCPAMDFLMPKITLLGNGGAVWILAAGPRLQKRACFCAHGEKVVLKYRAGRVYAFCPVCLHVRNRCLQRS